MVTVVFQIHGSPELEFVVFESSRKASKWIEDNFLEFSSCELHVLKDK